MSDGKREGPIRRWWKTFKRDVVASMDASLLAFLRFLGLLYGRIDRTLPINEAFRKARAYRLPAHAGWRHALGGITYVLFMILVVSGVLLSFYYRPSAQEAYPSIRHIVSGVPFGWLIRGIHVWAATLIVVAALLHMARVFLSGAYKPPRETNWIVGFLLLLVILAFGATGYLLPWDQWSYWTVTEALEALADFPGVGGFVAGLLMGDILVTGATLGRFYAWHVILLPWITLGLLMLHFSLVRKHGIAPPPADRRSSAPGVRFYPTHLLRSFIAGVLLLAIVMSLGAALPRSVGDPANPYLVPDSLVSSWIVADVTMAVIRFAGPVGFALLTLLALAVALLPLFDRGPEVRLLHRPVALVLGVLYFGTFLLLWVAGSRIDAFPPSTSVDPRALEERVLPAGPEIPATESSPASDSSPRASDAAGDGEAPR